MTNPYASPSMPSEMPEPEEGAGKAKASMILGLLSIIGWIIPLFGLPMTITGLVLGIKGLGPQRRGTAIVGIVLSSIFMVLTLLNMALGVYFAVQGQDPFGN